jgi:hypothetical protein
METSPRGERSTGRYPDREKSSPGDISTGRNPHREKSRPGEISDMEELPLWKISPG